MHYTPRAADQQPAAPKAPTVHTLTDAKSGVSVAVSVPADLTEGAKIELSDKRISLVLEIAAAESALEAEVQAHMRAGLARPQAVAAAVAAKPHLYTGGHNV